MQGPPPKSRLVLPTDLIALGVGSGSGHCDGERFAIEQGDVVAFPPGSAHGIDNGDDARMYTVEVRVPATRARARSFHRNTAAVFHLHAAISISPGH